MGVEGVLGIQCSIEQDQYLFLRFVFFSIILVRVYMVMGCIWFGVFDRIWDGVTIFKKFYQSRQYVQFLGGGRGWLYIGMCYQIGFRILGEDQVDLREKLSRGGLKISQKVVYTGQGRGSERKKVFSLRCLVCFVQDLRLKGFRGCEERFVFFFLREFIEKLVVLLLEKWQEVGRVSRKLFNLGQEF